MSEWYTSCERDKNIKLNSRREDTEESIINVLPNEIGKSGVRICCRALTVQRRLTRNHT